MTSLLTADDLFLFNQGTHYRLYQKLGAHILDGGTYFAVWAPNAQAVSAIGDWNGWCAGATPLRARESSGIWEGHVQNVGHGTRYKYAIVGPDGVVRYKLTARRMQHYPDDDTTLLDAPRLVNFRSSNVTVTATAKTATLSSNGENAYLNDDVRLVRTPYENPLHVVPTARKGEGGRCGRPGEVCVLRATG